jgi:S-formylglutathione hydrolase FrmB
MSYKARLKFSFAFIMFSTLLFSVDCALADGFTFTPLQVAGSNETCADAINNKGQVAGFYQDASGSHGFVETNGVLETLTLSGGVLNTSNFGIGVNDHLHSTDGA